MTIQFINKLNKGEVYTSPSIMPYIPHFVYQLFLLTYYYIETIVLINLFFFTYKENLR